MAGVFTLRCGAHFLVCSGESRTVGLSVLKDSVPREGDILTHRFLLGDPHIIPIKEKAEMVSKSPSAFRVYNTFPGSESEIYGSV